MFSNIAKIWNFILDLLYPVICQGCGKEGSYLCSECQGKIKVPQEFCLSCKRQSFLGRIHPECKKAALELEGIFVTADYQTKSIQNLIWHLKYHSVAEIAEILSLLMADYFVSRNLLDYFATAVVIPVPLFKRRLRVRGFNQAELLAQRFARRLNLEYLPILERIRNTKSQVELSEPERLQNVKNAFTVRPTPALGERKIILVDDVATTGATLNECAKVLKTYEAKEVWGLVVARN